MPMTLIDDLLKSDKTKHQYLLQTAKQNKGERSTPQSTPTQCRGNQTGWNTFNKASKTLLEQPFKAQHTTLANSLMFFVSLFKKNNKLHINDQLQVFPECTFMAYGWNMASWNPPGLDQTLTTQINIHAPFKDHCFIAWENECNGAWHCSLLQLC